MRRNWVWTSPPGRRGRQQWFLAAVLYGARISGVIAARTFRVFAATGVYSPEAIMAQGWDGLVALLDQGRYTRYDFKTAIKLLKIMETLQERYHGSLERLHEVAADQADLERRLMELAPGVGPATVNIFLRDCETSGPRPSPHSARQLRPRPNIWACCPAASAPRKPWKS